MIDIDTIIQNIEDKIHLLEKLKFDDDPKNFLYTPITAVTITSSTDFKQLECQKFIRCTRSNKLIPLGKFSDTVEALKDENSENLRDENEKEVKIGPDDPSMQRKRNYRRNSIANFNQKVPLEEKSSLAGKKRRNSTKFDIRKPSEVDNLKNPIENGQKKPKFTPAAIKPITTQTSSPLFTPRLISSTQPSKNPPLTKLDQQYTLKKPTHQAQTTTAPPAGSPKFSRSYTEFLNNLNKDMKKFKEQQKRNEPCDNFLGKHAKMFVEDPIAKHLGDGKATKVGVLDKKVDSVKSNGNKVEAVKKIDPKSATAVKIDHKTATATKSDLEPATTSKSDQKPATSNQKPATTAKSDLKAATKEKNDLKAATKAKTDASSTNKPDDVIRIPDSPPKTPIYGLKYLVKAQKPQPELTKNIFGKIVINPPESPPKLLNKLVMRRMTIDSSWDHRSLLRMKSDEPAGRISPKVQRIQLSESSPSKVTPNSSKTSPEKLQKIPAVSQDLIHQKIIRLSPQKPQNSNDDPKPDKLTKQQQNILKSLKQKIPRRNSIGYGVRIETANDIKRLKLSQDVRRTLGTAEAAKKVQEFSNGSSELKKRGRKPNKIVQNAGTAAVKIAEAPAMVPKNKSLKLTEKSSVFSNIIKNAVENTPITSIDFEDELENISACHIDKLAPTGTANDDQTKADGSFVNDNAIGGLKSRKSVNSNKEKVNKGSRTVISSKSGINVDDKGSNTKAENIVSSEPIQVKKRGRPSKKLKIDDKELKEMKIEDVDMKLNVADQRNNNLEDIEMEKNKLNHLTDAKDNKDKTKAQIYNKVEQKVLQSNLKVESKRTSIEKTAKSQENPNSNKTEPKNCAVDSKAQPKEGNKDSIDVVTSKTLDIFKDIENYRNLIRQRSSDSQNSNKTVESGSKSEATAKKSQNDGDKKQKVGLVPACLVKAEGAEKSEESEEKSLNCQNLKVVNESELVQQDAKLKVQNTELQTKNADAKPRKINLNSQNSSQSPQNPQTSTKLSQRSQLLSQTSESSRNSIKSSQDTQLSSQSVKTPKNSSQSTKVPSKSSQSSKNSQDSSQSSQHSQNSTPGTPIMSQSPQPSDSQTTSTPDQSLGKRRRQINPKYKESEYLLKNTSREFTNAIRSKMMVSKPLKTSVRKQSVKPDDQTPEKSLEILETSKPMEVPSTSTPTARPASSEIKCEICGKTFLKPQGLTRHMPLHSTDRRFKCNMCDYRFKQSSDLMRHMKLHDGSPSIPCPQCDKKFRTAKNLQTHLETHEDTLPFKCDHCEIRFRSSKYLKYHLMSHHIGIKFQCGYCGAKFLDENSLKTHVMQHEIENEDLDNEELEGYLDFMDEEEEELEDSDDEAMVIAE